MSNFTHKTDSRQSLDDREVYLSPQHREMLHALAITDDVIRARGYRTVTSATELQRLDFSKSQCPVPGLLMPLHIIDGQLELYVYRPDNPRAIERKGNNHNGDQSRKVQKYEMPKGSSKCIDCPPTCNAMLVDPNMPLWITNSQTKADALASIRQCAIALHGVLNMNGSQMPDATLYQTDFEFVALRNREVIMVIDSNELERPPVRQLLHTFYGYFQHKGAIVSEVYLPNSNKMSEFGVNKWLAGGHGIKDLEALKEIPRPLPQPAPDTIQILDNPPATINRPLCLLDGHAYGATWLHAKVIRHETQTKNGNIVHHYPPIQQAERKLFIVRDDGRIYGNSDNPIENLHVEIHLPEPPLDKKLWSARSVKAFSVGKRSNPIDVFTRVVSVVDRFIDFDRSLASQQVMCEFIACYILSTWFLDAFDVIGFLWPNGDRGSGKTNLLIIISELAYLGEFILASGSYASLRDLADYGATLCFDDAEMLADPKTTDGDKRALLLAGNRRGAKASLKEVGPDKKWHTRYVNAYCHRLFSAIRLPDPTLASRTIIIPLVRTSDRQRANFDPLDYESWPHNHRQLLDDLWGLAVAHLSELPYWDDWIGQHAKLTGRSLQPWRAVLAVAAWLDSEESISLLQRMETLSLDYQNERNELEASDLTILVIQSLIEHVAANVSNQTNVTNAKWEFTTATITKKAKQIANESDGDIDPEIITAQRVGHRFRQRRLEKPPRSRGQKNRMWAISTADLVKWAKTYGVPVPKEIDDI